MASQTAFSVVKSVKNIKLYVAGLPTSCGACSPCGISRYPSSVSWAQPGNTFTGDLPLFLALKKYSTLQRHNTENSKQIFPDKELLGLSPNFHIHMSVSDLYIPTDLSSSNSYLKAVNLNKSLIVLVLNHFHIPIVYYLNLLSFSIINSFIQF
jgi:hypothetical protein